MHIEKPIPEPEVVVLTVSEIQEAVRDLVRIQTGREIAYMAACDIQPYQTIGVRQVNYTGAVRFALKPKAEGAVNE